MKKLTLIIGLFFSVTAIAQENFKTFTIKVINVEGQSLSGATVRTAQSGLSSATDGHGEIVLTAHTGDTISVNHIGYFKQLVPVNLSSASRLIIVLHERTEMLDEVIVNTGYQKLPRERATGSFTQLTNTKYNELNRVNVLDNLQDVAGAVNAMPFNVLKMKNPLIIRGINSFTPGLTQPLIILDNFPYEGDINNINPNDVENITILKDAAAASIWGVKAGNGVIVITTKKGRPDQPVKLDFSSTATFISRPDLNYLKMIPTTDYINIERTLFDSGYYDSKIRFPNYYALTPVVNLLATLRAGNITQQQAEEQLKQWGSYDLRKDWSKYMYNMGFNQQYNLTVSGSQKKLTWLVTGAFNRMHSVADATNDRVNFRWDNSYQVSAKFTINTAVYFTQTSSVTGKPSFGQVNTNSGNLSPYIRLTDDNGNAVPVYNKYRQSYLDTAGRGQLKDWHYYPLTDYMHERNRVKSQDINAALNLQYKVVEGLMASVMYRYQDVKTDGRQEYDGESFFTRDLVNNFTVIATNGTRIYNVPNGSIVDFNNYRMNSQYVRGQLNYNRNFNGHTIAALAGSEVSDTKSDEQANRIYGFNYNTMAAALVDYKNPYPFFSTGGNSYIPSNNSLKTNSSRIVSIYGNASYTFHDRYTLSASVRKDASNLFGVDANNKWKPLWSVGGSWQLSREHFYHALWLPLLKLRVTYGKQGNIDPTQAAVTTIRYNANSIFSGLPTASIVNYPNPSLRWEEVQMLSIGLDFQTAKRRLTGSIEYFSKTMNDLFGEYLIETTTGLGNTTIIRNVGKMRGHGLDLELTHINLDGRLRWMTDLVFSTYNDKVVKSFRSPDATPVSQITGGGKVTMQGYPVWSLFAYKWMGLDAANGNPLGYLDGKSSDNYQLILSTGTKFSDLVYFGNQIPVVYGSLGNTLSYKGFSITPRVTYKFGYFFFRQSVNYNNLFGTGVSPGSEDYVNRWQQPGDELKTSVPSMVYPNNQQRDLFYQNAGVLVTKGDHIRLQYINCSYVFPLKSQKAVKSIRLSAILNNVGILWRANKYQIDPDYGSSNIPASKTFTLSLNINF